MANLDATTTEVNKAHEEHAELEEELGLKEATDGQEFVPKTPKAAPAESVVQEPAATTTATPAETPAVTPAAITPAPVITAPIATPAPGPVQQTAEKSDLPELMAAA